MEGMEGRRRRWLAALALGAVICGALAAGGCGSDSEAIETDDPATTFAPLVQLDPEERWRPMGASWFIARSSFWFADDEGCEDRKIAVGKTLEEQRTEITDFIFEWGLGEDTGYKRTSYDATCESKFDSDFSYVYFAAEHTRPGDLEDRAEGLRPGEGYYLDLVDGARKGPPLAEGQDGEAAVEDVPAYVERSAEGVDGEPGLRLTYWQLYGMNEHKLAADAPPQLIQRGGKTYLRPPKRLTHEGDWERVDVLLREGEGDDEYEPVEVLFYANDDDGGRFTVPWSRLRTVSDGRSRDATHPVLRAARGNHAMSAVREPCARCARWRTWRDLANARKQDWYGFGGAWGELGATVETTGPLGPHGRWFEPAHSEGGDSS